MNETQKFLVQWLFEFGDRVVHSVELYANEWYCMSDGSVYGAETREFIVDLTVEFMPMNELFDTTEVGGFQINQKGLDYINERQQ